MILTLHILLYLAATLVALPAAVLFVECLLAAMSREQSGAAGSKALPPRIALLISAHDEEAMIEATVRSLAVQLRPGDQLLVVADNCTDRTADLARAAGATVAARTDPERRGKGYGLHHGLEQLRQSRPDVVIIFDADCRIEPGVVQTLAARAWETKLPIQATYLLESPQSAGARGMISTLAFIVKNAVRPAGLARLGFPCALTGTGMAFPWELIENAPVASGHIVEDMELGLHLLRAGKGPRLCGEAMIRGQMPADTKAAYIQRTRWEHGHLSLIVSCALPLMMLGVRRRRLDLIVAGLDLTVPPLALLTGVCFMGTILSAVIGIHWRFWGPVGIFAAAGMMIGLAVFSAWRRHGRHLPMKALLAIPLYIIWKVPLYLKFLVRREKKWVRTARTTLPPVTDGATIA